MTWITDDTGTRWVDPPLKAARKPSRARKFENIKVGDQLMRHPSVEYDHRLGIYVVTDLWFDPVAGQDDPIKGAMVGYCKIMHNRLGRKYSTTIRGLASQRFDYADADYMAMFAARQEAMATGDPKVIGIGRGLAIRNRPKIGGNGAL